MKWKLLFSLFLTLASFPKILEAQTFPYSIIIESFTIPGLPGLHSFAAGHDNGKWVLIGGRLDGMHRGGGGPGNPAFPASSNNTNIYVVDPVAEQVWSASLASLSTPLQEQLQSTNTNFYQDGNWLYIAGGYGYSATAGDHVTYDKLTAVNVPNLIADIMNGDPITGNFLQTTHAGMRAAGGALGKIGNTFYLFGGIDFQGRYIMGGSGGGATGSMQYTDQIRTFEIVNDGSSLTITNYTELTNTAEYHRRDFNLVPQIFPGNVYGYMWSSGVFKAPNDEVYFNPIEIKASGITIIPEATFMQKYCNYYAPKMALYDPSGQDMFSIFFGGMAQFYFDAGGNEVEDPNVPFVETISLVSRDQNGTYAESVFSTEMPALVGAGAEFFPENGIAEYAHGIIDMSLLPSQLPFTVGYIYGGIASPQRNTFPNNTAVTNASSTIYRVKFGQGPMPVDLDEIHFVLHGQRDCADDAVLIEWHTQSERNTQEFIVERGKYGNFSAIGSVQAVGNSDVFQTYTFVDRDLPEGLIYYRLKILDKDGTFAYSPTLAIRRCGSEGVLEIRPNPTSGTVFVQGASSDFLFELVDVQGHRLEVPVSSTNNGLVLDLQKLPAGTYFLKTGKGSAQAYKIVKQSR